MTKEKEEVQNKNTNVKIHLEGDHLPYGQGQKKEDIKQLKDQSFPTSSSETTKNEETISKVEQNEIEKTEEDEKQTSETTNPITQQQQNVGKDKPVVIDEAHKTVWFINNIETEEMYKKSHKCEQECESVTIPYFEEPSLQCMKEFKMPDRSLFEKKIQPLPPLEEFCQWYSSVKERPLELSTKPRSTNEDQASDRGNIKPVRGL